ncbi:MAG: isochorismatase family protein [Synergistaceae bacterium]|jgi:nicotinamidase-related amidase|nr:isochorismatase family protein [Synergistaceae bacterium]
MNSNALVIIDPQNDFCDRRGSLYVEGAEADVERLSKYIARAGGTKSNMEISAISAIFVSLDSHDPVAIFHPVFWTNEAGECPVPFSQITPADFRSKKWKAAMPENAPFAERTFKVLEAKGFTLTVWPEHCIVSTWGHQVAEPLLRAFKIWREKTGLPVRYVFKGENPYTDQFSAFEGVDGLYPETAFNENVFARLAPFEQVTFAGEALSHCVGESILSYRRRLGKARQRVRLLADCTSPVGGFDRDASLRLLQDAGVELVVAEEN